MIAGTTFDRGGVYVAGRTPSRARSTNADRPFLSRGDYRAHGRHQHQQFNCSPATIRTPASGNNIYLSPSATTTVPQIADNAPCNNSIYGAAIPGSQRDNLLMQVRLTTLPSA